VLKRLFLIASLAIIGLFTGFQPNQSKAQETFATSANIEYKIHKSGVTTVTNIISIRNLTSDTFSASYIFNLNNLSPQNIKVFESGNELKTSQLSRLNENELTINFDEKIVGIGKMRTFVVTYEDKTLATRTGEVWEVKIPKLSLQDSFDTYKITLSIPKSFGKQSYISPRPIETVDANKEVVYTFNKRSLAGSGVSAAFGKFQVFSFTLNYHLQNPLTKTDVVKIAIPPDTSTQKILLETIEPAPINIVVDGDGNWIASFSIKPKKEISVKVAGHVQILAAPRRLLIPTSASLLQNTKPTEYWQSDDVEIKKLAEKLSTPKNIFDYVVNSLTYDVNRLQPNAQRFGAKLALYNHDRALCTEFTDLFIALARAAGIPAREINGFAYSQNPEIQPLSLVSDVLHSWPEYWDSDLATWIPVDPTWSSTTGGEDYFTKLDLRHFAFIIHGKSSTKPIPPGSYKTRDSAQKDVHVSPSKLPPSNNNGLDITHSVPLQLNPFRKKILIQITNNGQAAFYNIVPEIIVDGIPAKSVQLPVLPPSSNYKMEYTIDHGIFGKNTPSNILVQVEQTQVNLPTNKERVIVFHAISVFTILLILLTLIYFRLTKPQLPGINHFAQLIRKGHAKLKKAKFKQTKTL
jgi:hypothetical protein